MGVLVAFTPGEYKFIWGSHFVMFGMMLLIQLAIILVCFKLEADVQILQNLDNFLKF